MSMEQLLLSLRPTVCLFPNAIMGQSELSEFSGALWLSPFGQDVQGTGTVPTLVLLQPLALTELFFSSKVLTLLCSASEGRKVMISSGEGSFARNCRTSVAPSKPDCPAAFHSRRPSSMILGSWFLNGRSRIASSCGISTCSDANMLTRFSFTRSVAIRWRCRGEIILCVYRRPNYTARLAFIPTNSRQPFVAIIQPAVRAR